MTQRETDLDAIKHLYGTEQEPGRSMLMTVLSRHLLAMLPDQAIHELAEMQRAHDAGNARSG
jgi:hypothetical protein